MSIPCNQYTLGAYARELDRLAKLSVFKDDVGRELKMIEPQTRRRRDSFPVRSKPRSKR